MKKKKNPFRIFRYLIPIYALILLAVVLVAKAYPHYCFTAGRKALDEGNYAKAISCFEKAGSDLSGELLKEAYLNRGTEYLTSGDYDNALRDFTQYGLNQISAELTDALYDGFAARAEKSGSYAEAKEWLKKMSLSDGMKARMIACNLKLAEEAYAKGETDEAIRLLEENGDDSDSVSLRHTVLKEQAELYLRAGDIYRAETVALTLTDEGEDVSELYDRIIAEKKLNGDYSELPEEEQTSPAEMGIIATGNQHTVALRQDGTVLATGDNSLGQCDVTGWSDICAVSAGAFHTVGLKTDGTVVATGDNRYGQCDVAGYSDIIQIVAHTFDTVLLREDGSVVSLGRNHFTEDNPNMPKLKEIALGSYALVGIKADGGVYTTRESMLTEDFHSLKRMDASLNYAVGICRDGTLVTSALSCPDYTGVVGIDACSNGIFALINDGTVRFWSFRNGDENGFGWTDICAIASSGTHFVGMKNDGTFIACGDNEYGQCNVEQWRYTE